MKITKGELAFIIIMVLLSFINNYYFINFLNSLNPIYNFLIYYLIVYIALFILSKTGFVVFGVKVKKVSQVLGSMLILFAFFLVFNFENSFVQYFTTGSFDNISNVYLGSEDGVSVYLWSQLIHPTSTFNIYLLWFLAFPVTVALFSFIGAWLLSSKVKIEPATTI